MKRTLSKLVLVALAANTAAPLQAGSLLKSYVSTAALCTAMGLAGYAYSNLPHVKERRADAEKNLELMNKINYSTPITLEEREKLCNDIRALKLESSEETWHINALTRYQQNPDKDIDKRRNDINKTYLILMTRVYPDLDGTSADYLSYAAMILSVVGLGVLAASAISKNNL